MKKIALISLLAFCHAGLFSLIAQNASSVWTQLRMSHSNEWNLADSIQKYRTGIIVVKTSPGTKVELEQQKHEFWFGCALNSNAFDGKMADQDAGIYKQKFLENFNVGVTASSLKWHHMEPEKGKVDFLTTENILAWADDNNLPLRGHNLFWGIYYVQDWVKALTDDQLYDELHKRAITIASRYKGRFAEYDFNNEMMHGDYYQERLGPGITKKMAGWIKEYDPDAKLYLNDYDILTGRMLQEYTDHIKDMQKRGVPISGIGVQGHLHAEDFSRDTLRYALDVLAQFGLPVKITEFNMPGQRSKYQKDTSLIPTKKEEEQFAQNLKDYYRICFAHPAVEAILMWHFWAGANWIPASSLYRKDWTTTPATTAYKSLVFDEWWTRFKGKSDEKGYCVIRAFYGVHKIKVNGVEKIIEIRKQDKTAYIEF
ncbi:MAG TPA: endo-1,4-beta-xylanase [Bacteroidales bacterium]|nr:endo-1,4-beta-xylanase [Bacteroidales bacterium]